MPTLGTKETASMQVTAPSYVSENTASQSPVKLHSPVAGGPVLAQVESKAMPEPQVHPMVEFSEDPQVKNMKAFCNICLVTVRGSEVLGHLYFGTLKCANCLFVINQCRDFKDGYPSKLQCPKDQVHHIMTRWEQPLWSHLTYSARKYSAISRFCGDDKSSNYESIIISYLNSLKPLKYMQPWKTVFEDPEVKKNIDKFSKILKSQRVSSENGDQNKLPPSLTSAHCRQIQTGYQSKITKSMTNMVTAKAQTSNFIKKSGKDKPVEKAEKECAAQLGKQTTTVGTPTAETLKLQKSKFQEKGAKDTSQKSTPTYSAVARPTRTSDPQATKVQESKTKGSVHHSTPAPSSTSHMTQKSIPEKRMVQQEKPRQQSTSSTSSGSQTKLKSKLDNTKGQKNKTKDKENSSPTTSAVAQSSKKLDDINREKSNMKNLDLDRLPLLHSFAQRSKRTKLEDPRRKKSQRKNDDQDSLAAQPILHTKKRQHRWQESEFIPQSVLNSEHYLVVWHPEEECPEECPECYFSFDPSMCTVNFSTFIINFTCPNCKLSVYVVPKEL